MDSHTPYSWLGPVITVITTLIGASAGFLGLYWSTFRKVAKRQTILDFATKQVAFWDSCLKVELSATTDDIQQKTARDRAFAAIQRVRSHADQELELLAWKDKRSQSIAKDTGMKSFFSLSPNQRLAFDSKLSWYVFKTFSFLWLLIYVIQFVSLIWFISKKPHLIPSNLLEVGVVIILMFVAALVSAWMRILAERAKYIRPDSPHLETL